MTKCTAKHTAYQPTAAEWLCPKCGIGGLWLHVDRAASNSAFDCSQLHDYDLVTCDKCNYSWSGRQVSEKIQEKSRSVKQK